MGKHRNRQPDACCDEASEESTENCEGTRTNNEKCPHMKKGVVFRKLRKTLQKNGIAKECPECRNTTPEQDSNNEKEERITPNSSLPWICLNCGYQGCNIDRKGHAKTHFKAPHSDCHSLVVDSSQWTVWCYECEKQINVNCWAHLSMIIEYMKKMDNKISLQTANNSSPSKTIQSVCQKESSESDINGKPEIEFPVLSGLANLGNTCFFNAVLQCLVQTPFLIKVLEDMRSMDVKFVLPGGKCKLLGDSEEEIDLPPIEGTVEKLGSNSVTSVLCQTLIDLNTQNASCPKTYRPLELMNSIRKKLVYCMDGGQHDSHEFLRQLLEVVRNEDLKRYQCIILNELGLKKCVPDNVDKNSKSKVKFYGHQASSRLLGPDRVFRGVLVSIVTCLECHNTSMRTEPFLDLSLPVMTDKPQPPSVNKKKNNGFDETVDQSVDGDIVKRRKMLDTTGVKKIIRRHSINNRYSLANKNSIVEEKTEGVAEFEESDADVEDNIETEGAGAPEVNESGYSSEKASALSSPIPLAELPLLYPTDNLGSANGLLVHNDIFDPTIDSEMLQYRNVANVSNSPSPTDVSMTDLTRGKFISELARTGSLVSLENGTAMGLSLQGSLAVNSDLTSPEGPTISPLSSPITSKDSPTSPMSSAVDGEGTDKMDKPMCNIDPEKSVDSMDIKKEGENNNDNGLPKKLSLDADTDELLSAQSREDDVTTNSNHRIKNIVNEVTTDLTKLDIMNSSSHQSPSRYFTKEGECSIQSCLNQFAALELMSGNNKVGCEACTKRENKGKEGKMVYTQSTLQYLLLHVPPVLILHLKRFQSQRSDFRKVTKHVSFPMVLDLAPVCKDRNKKRLYALYGVVEHKGILSGGHYVAYIKSKLPLESDDQRWSFLPKIGTTKSDETSNDENSEIDKELASTNKSSIVEPPPGRWFCASDSRVIEVDEKTVLQSQAYLLFYERIL